MMRRFRRNPTEDERSAVESELRGMKDQEKNLLNEVNKARAHGDLRENFEYHAAKEALRMARIREAELKKMLSEQAAPLPPQQEALIGSIIVYNDEDQDMTKVIQVAPPGRGDSYNCFIDVRSPLIAAMSAAANREYDAAVEMLQEGDELITQSQKEGATGLEGVYSRGNALQSDARLKLKKLMPGVEWVPEEILGSVRSRPVVKPGFKGFAQPYPGMTFGMVHDRNPVFRPETAPDGSPLGMRDPVIRTFTVVAIESTSDEPRLVKMRQDEAERALLQAGRERESAFQELYTARTGVTQKLARATDESTDVKENRRVRRNPVLDLTLRRHAAELKKKLSRGKLEKLRFNLQALIYGTDPGKIAYQYGTLSRDNLIRLVYLLADA
jgi:transcription elongation factor GreA